LYPYCLICRLEIWSMHRKPLKVYFCFNWSFEWLLFNAKWPIVQLNKCQFISLWFDSTGIRIWIYHSRGQHTNNYTIEEVFTSTRYDVFSINRRNANITYYLRYMYMIAKWCPTHIAMRICFSCFRLSCQFLWIVHYWLAMW
jgi:hypothetical protein